MRGVSSRNNNDGAGSMQGAGHSGVITPLQARTVAVMTVGADDEYVNLLGKYELTRRLMLGELEVYSITSIDVT